MTAPSPPPPQKVRWKTPVVVVVLAVVAIAALHHREWVESYIAAYATIFVSALAAIILFLWFAFFSGLRRKTRLRGSLIAVALIAALLLTARLTVRVEGTVSGVGVPRLVWKWTPRTGQNTPALNDVKNDDAHPVDLTKTTNHDFPQFLGPTRNNVIAGNNLGHDWAANPPKKRWSRPVGLGWGSFAVVGDWAITQEQRGSSELTVCYDVNTGQPRWEFSHPNTRFTEWQGGDGPRATPTIDAGRVYVMGATGLLDCLDGATGKAVWSRNVMADTHSGVTSFGKSCSPLIIDDLVIITGGRGASLVAYRKSDGSPAWTGGTETPGYASPMPATLGNVRQILTINAQSAAGHDLADGKLLWEYPWPGSLPKVPSAFPIGNDRVLIACGYGIGSAVPVPVLSAT